MIYKVAMVVFIFTVTSISVGGPAQAVTAAQKAYDACAGFNNATFRYMAGHKAAYAGLDGDLAKCYWSYGRQSLVEAQTLARNSCAAQMPSCFLFADDNGLQGWVAQIVAGMRK
jgi:hypothetical protein